MTLNESVRRFPETPIDSEEKLIEILTKPTPRLPAVFSALEGGILVLGAGGKMGPSLCIMAKRAADEAGRDIGITAVDLFPDKGVIKTLESAGIATITCDMLEPGALDKLPDAPYVIYMAGMKFGASSNRPLTWTLNAFLPGLAAARFIDAHTVVFSTGNVYPLFPVISDGPAEDVEPGPVGEYAMSCLGRERVFTYYSEKYGTPVCIFRLNYAVELRYGVLVDIALKIWHEEPVDLTMSYFNAIWQADACERALLCLQYCQSPPKVINITGADSISVSGVANHFGRLMKKDPIFTGERTDTALLSDASLSVELFGEPSVSLKQMIEWISFWVMSDLPVYNKPTHFETRDGSF